MNLDAERGRACPQLTVAGEQDSLSVDSASAKLKQS
jgi:hypothetical protein